MRGSIFFVTRFFGTQLVGFAASIGIARLVAPDEFGQFAIALAVQQGAATLVFLGLASGLIREPAAPTAAEQRSVTGYAFAGSLALVSFFAIVAFAILPLVGDRSTTAELIAIAATALPLLSLRVVPVALLNRELRFERVMMIEGAGRVTFHAAALTGAAIGLGAYGLAAAAPVGAMVSAVMATRWADWSRGFAFDPRVIRHLLAFGIKTSSLRLITVLQEVSIVTLSATVGSQAVAGFYAMSRRVLGVPYAAAGAFQRVGFPALARLEAPDLQLRQAARAAPLSAVAVGLALALVVGAAEPLISTLFGRRWLPSVEVIATAAAGLMVFSTLGSMVVALAVARGELRRPLIAASLHLATTVVLVLTLVPSEGALGAGIAAGASYLIYATVLVVGGMSRGVREATGLVLRALLIAATAAGVAQAFGFQHGVDELVGALAISGGTWLVLSWVFMRSQLRLLSGVLRRAFRPPHPDPMATP